MTTAAPVRPPHTSSGPLLTFHTTRQPQLLRIMTPRRIQILTLAANGHTNQQIAEHLVLSVETVKTHMRQIHAVLGARDRAHAVALGILRGFVPASAIHAA
ncbi:response regulator transcription factor [Streptomyces sp. NPDC059740]|uniref:response regulator transcription factor n=1 Tax=Streptomyces sp. NPDC059740 TaxID=3346926 RepID=UPI00365EABE8